MLTVRTWSAVTLFIAVLMLGSGLVIGYAQAPQPRTVYVPAQEQSPEEWLEERKQINAMVSSAQQMAATIEKQRIQVCLLPDEYPDNVGSWCKQTYYRNLVKAVRR